MKNIYLFVGKKVVFKFFSQSALSLGEEKRINEICWSPLCQHLNCDIPGRGWVMLTCVSLNLFSFEFVKASGTEIVSVNVPEGQEITGKILKHISTTGPVYIRRLSNVEVKL